jgi:hypothetical protein
MLFASEWVAARNKEVWLPVQQPKLHHLFIQLGGFYSLQVMLDAAQSH